MARRKSRAGTLRRICFARRHKSTGSVSPCRWQVGDLVRFASPLRPDLLPFKKSGQHGEIISTGLWGITVRFFDFPDEPLFLGLNEIRKATGTRTGEEVATRRKRRPKTPGKTDWEKWNPKE